MPFVVIGEGRESKYIKLSANTVNISKPLYSDDKIWVGRERVELLFDRENNLFGIRPISGVGGYKRQTGRVYCYKMPKDLPKGKFVASYDEQQKMIIADLNEEL
jgi:hypothetical protein